MSAGRRKFQHDVASGRRVAQPQPEHVAKTAAASRREIDLLTPVEVARMLRIPVALLYKWRSLGIGPKGFKMGRYVRYWRSSVLRWLEEQERLSSG